MITKTSTKGDLFVTREEGVILYAYDDVTNKKVIPGTPIRGTLTIGIGHTSAAGGPPVVPGQVITFAQAEQLLADDLIRVERDVNKYFPASSQEAYDGAISFHYNTGRISTASWVPLYLQGNMVEAEAHLKLWHMGNGIPHVLDNRRQHESDLIFRKNYGILPVDHSSQHYEPVQPTSPKIVNIDIPVVIPQVPPTQTQQLNPFIQILINIFNFLFRKH